MEETLPLSNRPAYWAFISYSHKDSVEAKWLHQQIERWRLPVAIRAQVRPRFGEVSRLFPVFRDRDELPNSANLGQNLAQALDASRTLIVICSPRSAGSRWVNEEVLHFKRSGRADRIFPVIIDGAPNATDSGHPEQECFCPALRHPLGEDGQLDTSRWVEPIAADLRPEPFGDGRRNALLKTLAGILGVAFDSLKQRDRLRRRRQMAAVSMLGAVVLGVAGLALYQTRQQQIATVERQAGELLALAEARFRRADYDTGHAYLRDALATRQAIDREPSAEQLALLYRALLGKPGMVRISGTGDSPLLKPLADGLLLLPQRLDAATPLIDARDLSLYSHLDLTPIRDYLLRQGFDGREIRLLSGQLEAAADFATNRLYLLLEGQLFTYDLAKGTLLAQDDLATDPGLSALASRANAFQELEMLGQQLVLGLESAIALGLPGHWTLIPERQMAEWEAASDTLYLTGEAVLERYQGGVLRAQRRFDGNIDATALHDGRLSLVQQAAGASTAWVLDASTLDTLWRCEIPAGRVIQTEPFAPDGLLVATAEPAMLWRYRTFGDHCQLEAARDVAQGFFDYHAESGYLTLSGLQQSELLTLTAEGFAPVARTPYPWARLNGAGHWYANTNDRLLELWARGPFFSEALQGRLLSASTDALAFHTAGGLRVVTTGDATGEPLLLPPQGPGPYRLVDRQGRVVQEILPSIDEQTYRQIVATATQGRQSPLFAGHDLPSLLERVLRTHGLLWHSPIHGQLHSGAIYGITAGALSRIDVANARLEWLPVPRGQHHLDPHSGDVWTRTPESALMRYRPGEPAARIVEGSTRFFGADAEQAVWHEGDTGIAFSLDGRRTLVFDTRGHWGLVDDLRLYPANNPSTRGLRLRQAAAEADGWLVATRDERLVRLSADGNEIRQQAPVRPDTTHILVQPGQGLILIGNDEGVALHDAAGLGEIAFIPGSGRFQALADGGHLLLASESREQANEWHLYRLPAFAPSLLGRLDELRLAPAGVDPAQTGAAR